MMYLVKSFSVLLMIFCALFTLLYCFSFFSDKWGHYPSWSFLILAIMAAASVIMWKVSSSELKNARK
jgi:hypothetical protein